MGLSEAAKQNAAISRKEYDKENMKTLTTKVKTETAKAFEAFVQANGTTVSRVLGDYVRSVLQGGENMPAKNPIEQAVVTGKEKAKVEYNLWASTIDGMSQIAQKSGVPVDDLINGVLCEFIAKWTGSQQ